MGKYARAALVATAVASTLAVLPSPSEATATRDARATGAYLRASYEFDRDLVANHAGSEAAVVAYAKRLGDECPGVLANAPSVKLVGGHVEPEHVKALEQEAALEAEVLVAVLGTWFSPSLDSFQSFARTVRPLRWHEARIARLVRAELAEFAALLTAPPDVCADMQAWVGSGYQTLPPGTLAASNGFPGNNEGPSLAESIAQLEIPALKPLVRRRKRVLRSLRRQLEHALHAADGLLATLGAKMPMTTEEPPTGDVIGHGTTAAGTTYTITKAGPAKDCPISLTLAEVTGNGNQTFFDECLSRSTRATYASTGCNEGNLTIHAPLPPSVRSVALKLANGHTIVSPALSISAADGGPLGFYYQALPHSSARPVSLVELDEHDRRMGVIAIARDLRCRVPKPGESTSSGSIGVANRR